MNLETRYKIYFSKFRLNSSSRCNGHISEVSSKSTCVIPLLTVNDCLTNVWAVLILFLRSLENPFDYRLINYSIRMVCLKSVARKKPVDRVETLRERTKLRGNSRKLFEQVVRRDTFARLLKLDHLEQFLGRYVSNYYNTKTCHYSKTHIGCMFVRTFLLALVRWISSCHTSHIFWLMLYIYI